MGAGCCSRVMGFGGGSVRVAPPAAEHLALVSVRNWSGGGVGRGDVEDVEYDMRADCKGVGFEANIMNL